MWEAWGVVPFGFFFEVATDGVEEGVFVFVDGLEGQDEVAIIGFIEGFSGSPESEPTREGFVDEGAESFFEVVCSCVSVSLECVRVRHEFYPFFR